MAGAVRLQAVFELADARTRLGRATQARLVGRADVERPHRGALGPVRAAQAGHDVLLLPVHVAAADPLRVAEGGRQVARVHRLDQQGGGFFGLLRVAGRRITERIVDVGVAGGAGRPEMRVLEDPHVGDEQRAAVGRERDPVRITARLHRAHHRGKVVRLAHQVLAGGAGGDLRGVDHEDVEAALVHDVEVPAILAERHVAREGPLETAGRRVHHVQGPVQGMGGPVQVDGPDDGAGARLAHPDVAVL